ncbi:TOMM precursor leader peptide-binding protein [Pseudomonas alloputida]|uniref:TOMM precursor leader peptide-binding protein n=1 Tax=Pseudomonas alloputida TaxID=1940621 RepID=UPI001E29206E|nr:TOMM precursor leader peptide-binding protein [Pseudomonas alloputida]MCE1058438.1 TOMM precursor leader peptide-binding protein [Pseudomonas alloputida]
MIDTPVFHAHFLIEVIDNTGVLLLSENESHALHGELYVQIAKLMNGQNSVSAISKALEPNTSIATTLYAIQTLENSNLICEAHDLSRPTELAYWSQESAKATVHSESQGMNNVWVEQIGKNPIASLLKESLEMRRLLASSIFEAKLIIVITDDYLNPELKSLSQVEYLQNVPWLLARPSGKELLIGPWFTGSSSCYECLRIRISRNKPIEEFIRSRRQLTDKNPSTAIAHLPETIEIALNIILLELQRFIRNPKNSSLIGKVLSLNTFSWQTKLHNLDKSSHCHLCIKQAGPPKPIVLNSKINNPLTYARIQRNQDYQTTLKNYENLIDPLTGIVSSLTKISEQGAFVYTSGHNPAYNIDSLAALQSNLRTFNSGKGITDAQARVSALCEAIERYSGEYSGNEYYVKSSMNEAKFPTIHPNQCMLYSDQQFKDRDIWNSKASRFNKVPEYFDPTEEIHWTPLWSLSKQSQTYFPTQYLYFGAPLSISSNRRVCPSCSNGNAAGNTIEEAILHGILELVERDCASLWWYNRIIRPRVDVISFKNPSLDKLIDYYNEIGRDTWVIDITSDFKIPCFAAISKKRSVAHQEILIGLGCHLDAHTALIRALTEMHQMLGNGGLTSEGDRIVSGVEDSETINWLNNATVESEVYLAFDATQPPNTIDSYAKLISNDVTTNILSCRNLLESTGLEIFVLDQTREDTQLPVVKIIIPGLWHFWARFAPGRLYDVPVTLGWLKTAHAESELNPTAIFF